MPQYAVNPSTGERLVLDKENNRWVPAPRQAPRVDVEQVMPEGPEFMRGKVGDLGEAAPSFLRGMASTAAVPATAAAKQALLPWQLAADVVPSVPQPPQLTGMEVPEAFGLQAPTTPVGRFAELAGASAAPGAGMVGAAARAGRALPVAATEAASLVGAGLGQEAAGLPGMLAGSVAPASIGTVARGISGAAPRFGARAEQQRLLGAFERQGVPATVGDITDIAYPQRAAATLPGGYGAARRMRAEQAGAMGRRVEELTGGRAAALEPDIAGEAIRKGMEGWIDKSLRGVARRIDDRLKARVPAETPTTTDETLKALSETIEEAGPFTAELVHPALTGIAKKLDDLQAGDGMSYKQLLNLRSAIGRKMSSPSIMADIPMGQLKQLYKALSKDIEATTMQVGDKRAVELLQRRNRHWRKGMARVENFVEPILKKKVPEEAYAALQKSAEKGPTRIRELSKTLEPKQREVVIGTMLREMGEPTPGVRSVEYTFSPETFYTNLNKLDEKGFVSLARGTQYARSQHLKDLRDVASRLREVDKVLKNPSGTSYALLSGGAGLIGMGGVALGRPLEALAVLGTTAGGSWATAKLMSSPSFVKWIAQGAKTPASRAAGHFARLNVAMAEDEETREAIEQYKQLLNPNY